MTSPQKSRSSSRLVFLLVVWGAVCLLSGAQPVLKYVPAEMKTFSPHVRTHCVGRYLIDLPEDMGDPFLTFSQFFFGLGKDFKKVEVNLQNPGKVDFDEFKRRVTARHDALETAKNEALKRPLLLHSEIVQTVNGDAVLLRFLDNAWYSIAGIRTEIHAYVNGKHLWLDARTYYPEEDMADSSRIHYRNLDPRPVEERLKIMVRALRPVHDIQQPPAGFCIAGILFDPHSMGYDDEQASFSFVHGPDEARVRFEVSMEGKMARESCSLFETIEEKTRLIQRIFAEAGNGGSSDTILHRTRRLSAMDFEEYGVQIKDSAKEFPKYTLMNCNSQPASEMSWTRPAMEFTLGSGEVGNKNHSPLGHEQILQIWDQWVGTLRLAPANGASSHGGSAPR